MRELFFICRGGCKRSMFRGERRENGRLLSFRSAVRRLQSKGILVQTFPLHETEELKRLSFSWYQQVKLRLQPLGRWHTPTILHPSDGSGDSP